MNEMQIVRAWLADIDDFAQSQPSTAEEQAKRDALARVLSVAEAAADAIEQVDLLRCRKGESNTGKIDRLYKAVAALRVAGEVAGG